MFGQSDRTARWINKQLHSNKYRSMHVNRIVEEEKKNKKEKTFKEQMISQDGKNRINIQMIIRRMVAEGKTIEEIKEALNANPEFSKFSNNFENWIIDYQNKHRDSCKLEAGKIITKMLQEGNLTEQIIEELNRSEKYQKYAEYFQDWIEEYYNKMINEYKKKISAIILRRLMAGKNDQEILENLRKRPDYEKYAEFLPSWIEQLKNSKGILEEQEEKEH